MKRKYRHTIEDYLKAGNRVFEIINEKDEIVWENTNGKIPNHLRKMFFKDVEGGTIYV